MRKNVLLYLSAFVLLLAVLLFFNRAYRELTVYTALTERHNAVYRIFQNLSKQIDNAAILSPALIEASKSEKAGHLFFTDSLMIMEQLSLLKSTARDSVNIRIAGKLEAIIKPEISWLLQSNVPDSIIHHKAPTHIASFQTMDSLINQGIQRTNFLVVYRQQQLNGEIAKVRIWMMIFILLSGILLIYTSINLSSQQSKTKRKEKELENVFSRINDAVVSVDNNWRYTFLNDAALATHPLPRKETLGKIIWDVHPEMKGTIFWDKYHEAMQTGKVIETEDYYSAMNTWFFVKIYPSPDGLTIFYKDITETKVAAQQLLKTLKELEDYKYAIDESSIVAITDQKGIIRHANQNFCRISKYTEQELIGQDHRIINSGYHSKDFIRNLWVTIAKGEIWKGELKNIAKDGTTYWVDTTIVPFLDEKGKPYQYIAIRADITKRKRVEEDLASSEMRFRSLIENSSEGIVMTDEFSNAIYRSPATEKITGSLPVENTINRTHPDDMETIKNKRVELMRKPGIPIPFQGRFMNAEGHYIWMEGTFTNLLNLKGVNAIVTNYRDITQRKAAEEKLIRSEKIYRTIASSIPGSVICLLDQEFRYLLIEGDMLEKLGYKKSKLLGARMADVLPAKIFASVQEELQRVLSGQIVTRESVSNGYDIISRFIPLKDENNFVYAIMTVAIDITKLKNAQRNIAELNRGLEEKINQRTEQLRKINKDLEDFSYSVSHDLRAPLRIIDGYAQMLSEDYSKKLGPEGKQTLGVITDSARKMGQLIDDLLSFAKTGRSEMHMTITDMNTLIDEVIEDLKISGIHIPAQVKINKLKPAACDGSLLKQVWINLVSNAIKYSGAKKEPAIEIGMTDEKDKQAYYIKDNGAGFDMKYADKLFGVFQRLHKQQEFAGTGVGLAIVQRIIERHGGTVWAEAKVNEGACFYFTLPG